MRVHGCCWPLLVNMWTGMAGHTGLTRVELHLAGSLVGSFVGPFVICGSIHVNVCRLTNTSDKHKAIIELFILPPWFLPYICIRPSLMSPSLGCLSLMRFWFFFSQKEAKWCFEVTKLVCTRCCSFRFATRTAIAIELCYSKTSSWKQTLNSHWT